MTCRPLACRGRRARRGSTATSTQDKQWSAQARRLANRHLMPVRSQPKRLRLKSRLVLLRRFGVQRASGSGTMEAGQDRVLVLHRHEYDSRASGANLLCSLCHRDGLSRCQAAFWPVYLPGAGTRQAWSAWCICVYGRKLCCACAVGTKQPTEQYGGWRKKLDYLTLSQQKRLSQAQDAFLHTGIKPSCTSQVEQ